MDEVPGGGESEDGRVLVVALQALPPLVDAVLLGLRVTERARA
jgi:hypothetical protein